MNLNKKEKETLMYCVFAFAVGYLMCMYFPIHSKTNGGYVLEGVDNANDKADNNKADNNKADKKETFAEQRARSEAELAKLGL